VAGGSVAEALESQLARLRRKKGVERRVTERELRWRGIYA